MSNEPKSLNRFADSPRDKPRVDRTEHANLERPGAQSHPRASGWSGVATPAGWRLP